MPFLWHCSTNGKLRILVKAQPAPQAPGHALSPTRLGIRPRDLGLSNEYTLGHCDLSAASKTQTGNHNLGHKPRWWFVIHAKEEDLATLESVWSAVFDHTQWKLCPCYKPIFDLPTEPNDSEPTQISQMSPTANSTNHFTASSIAPNKNPHFLGATSGETTTPP